MTNAEDTRYLVDSSVQSAWMKSVGVNDTARALSNLQEIVQSGITETQFINLCTQIESEANEISDLDMAINNLEKFMLAARSPLSLAALFERDTTAIPILLRIFSTSQHLSDLLIRDTESYDSLRLTEGQLYSKNLLEDEILAAVERAKEPIQAMQILRRFKRREILRIAFGDIIVRHRFEQVAEQISFLADALVNSALQFVIRQAKEKWTGPRTADGRSCRYVVFALGKLGGIELNYSSDIDLIAVYEKPGNTQNKRLSNQQFFERVTRGIIQLLSEATSSGAAYRVDMRLRPQGSQGPVCCHEQTFINYYERQGRTWERQALIKARPIAGDLEFGRNVLKKLENWVYRPVLNRFDIGEIKSLKRKIEKRTHLTGEEETNVKTGHGGIRDVEFTIQFLQLLHGGVKKIRCGNTLQSIQLLVSAHCLKQQEAELLSQNYRWLRKVEHFLQIMFNLQTHTLPEGNAELAKLAIRMGYRDAVGSTALDQFSNDFSEIKIVNRRILNHILHDAFPDHVEFEADSTGWDSDFVDFVLDSGDQDSAIEDKITTLGFENASKAIQLLRSLGKESTVFLSSRRCRHFLAAIVNELMNLVGETPYPDETLVSLSAVADVIGGKGALWELFHFNAPTMELFVRLCATSEYLCSIFRRNPGMIDELIDSLSMNSLPSKDWLELNLRDVTTDVEDSLLILNGFKHIQHLRVGIRDIIGRDSIRDTHRTLADVAEVCLEKIAAIEFERCARKHSNGPMRASTMNEKNKLVILALGKLGGQEPNYHSDLDVIFLYQADGHSWLSTSPQHFYGELAKRISRAVNHLGPTGKLYDLDSRLRPSGRSGVLAVSFDEFERYFESAMGQLWERLALCKARAVFGSEQLRRVAIEKTRKAIGATPWLPTMAQEIKDMRFKMQENCQPENLKRGIGGTVDVEFVVQMLQVKQASQQTGEILPGTIDALDQFVVNQQIQRDCGVKLIEGYQFLRGVEARLRLMNTTARHDLPQGAQLQRLAYLLRIKPRQLVELVKHYRQQNRSVFETVFDSESI